jgi:hypothetical protein
VAGVKALPHDFVVTRQFNTRLLISAVSIWNSLERVTAHLRRSSGD